MFFAGAMVLLSLLTCFTAIVTNIHHRGDHHDRASGLLRTIVLNYMARMVCKKEVAESHRKAADQVGVTDFDTFDNMLRASLYTSSRSM